MQNLWRTLRYITAHPINRSRKFAALTDFLKWQLATRMLKMPVVFNWIHGTKLIVESGESGLTGNVYTGLHEFVDMAFVVHCLRSSDLFVDIGANRGSYTILASGVCRCKSIAIEPIPSTFGKLISNVKVNELDALVECFNCGLADKTGKLFFSLKEDSVNHVVHQYEEGKSLEVSVTTLDELLDGKLPSMMKIDVEGYEYPVLKGGDAVLSSDSLKAIIVEVNDSATSFGFSSNQVAECLKSYGFVPCQYEPFDRQLTEVVGFSQNSCNTIFARDPAWLSELAKSGPSYLVRGCKI